MLMISTLYKTEVSALEDDYALDVNTIEIADEYVESNKNKNRVEINDITIMQIQKRQLMNL